MFNSAALRRLVAVTLLVGFVALPVPAALAAGEGGGEAAEAEDQGVLEQAIDWLLNLFGGGGELDHHGQIDPNGHA